MKTKKLGKFFTHEQELTTGTSQGVLLAKLENVVLVDVSATLPGLPGGKYTQTFTFAAVASQGATKGAVRLDHYNASTGELTEGNDIVVDLTPENAGQEEYTAAQKTYQGITAAKKDRILEALRNSGATINGNNPWDVDLHNNGVKMSGLWNESNSSITITITDKNWYVPESKIWSTIDGLIAKL